MSQHYKSYEQAALEILQGKKPEEGSQQVQQEQKQEEQKPQDLSEEVHPDALHVKPVKVDGKTKYKVHAVGSNHSSGIKVGEHLSDSELDDFSEMGGKIKHMKEEAEDLDEVTINDPLSKKVGPIRARDNTTGRVSPEDQKWGKEQVKQSVKTSIQRMKTDKKPNLPEEVEEDYDQLIEEKNAFEIELPEQLIFADYLKAAMLFTESREDAITVADYFFRKNDESIVIESFTRSDIEDRVKMHHKAGNQTTMPKYGSKDGKPYAEYTVTEKDTGKKTKYIHHGTARRVERLN